MPDHPSHLAHHFETPQQQFDSGKLGMWLFLTTEILLFSGLFCAYAVYRANHPEVFFYAHKYLSVPLGALNTMVLILSSFTMAAAVRAAQLGSRHWLILLLAVTLACGFTFLSIKGVEYKDKWEEGLLTGGAYRPEAPPPGAIVPSTKPRPAVAPVRKAMGWQFNCHPNAERLRRPPRNRLSLRPRSARRASPRNGSARSRRPPGTAGSAPSPTTCKSSSPSTSP